MLTNYNDEFDQLVQISDKVNDFHPALKCLYPVALVDGDCFNIFEFDRQAKKYSFRKQIPLPMPVPKGVRAAFPLEDYDERMACVVTPDVFDSPEGFVTILHEFVHCYQFETCEQKLKLSLDVARKAQEVGDYMWEIEHPFPYKALDFIRPYQAFLSAMAENAAGEVHFARQSLRNFLGLHDFEYMVWQEWKEGFARWVENKVKQKLGLSENIKGLSQPFSRVVFYAGGEAYINFLTAEDKLLVEDLNMLFQKMLNHSTDRNILND